VSDIATEFYFDCHFDTGTLITGDDFEDASELLAATPSRSVTN